MDRDNTILIVAKGDATWDAFVELMTDRHGYRVLTAATEAEALALARDVHVDLAIAEESNRDFDGCAFLSGLRISHPDVVRVLVLAKGLDRAGKALKEASVYQYVRKRSTSSRSPSSSSAVSRRESLRGAIV